MDVRGLKVISAVPVRCVFSARTPNMKQFAVILSGLSEVFRLKGSGSELWCMCVIHSHSFVFALHLLERWWDVCRDEMNAGIYACLYLTRLLFEEASLLSFSSRRLYKCYMQEHAILLRLWSPMNMLHLFAVHFCIIQYLCACVLHAYFCDALYLNAPAVIHTHRHTLACHA